MKMISVTATRFLHNGKKKTDEKVIFPRRRSIQIKKKTISTHTMHLITAMERLKNAPMRPKTIYGSFAALFYYKNITNL